MIVVEGKRAFHLAGQAWVVEQDRELAWAEPYVVKSPLYAYVLGKFVGTGSANANGHIFNLEDLRTAKDTVLHSPMNLLHRPHHIMGTFVANELVYPIGESAEVAEVHPYMEALGVFWKYYFQDEYQLVAKSHAEGTLGFSMECIPESITCAGGCDNTYLYLGSQDESYCNHLNQPSSAKKLNKPRFSAGALVIPPAQPAWRNAKVSELSSMVAAEIQRAESIYTQAAEEFPHLDGPAWETLMLQLLEAATRDDLPVNASGGEILDPALARIAVAAREQARNVMPNERKNLAKKKKALPDGSYPIASVQDLKNAIQAFGRAKNPAAAKAHIIRQAKKLGATGLLPKGWA